MQLANFYEADESIRKCLCGHVFAFEPGNLDIGYKDNEGKNLTDEALVHMSLNRINCPKCSKIFCYSCKAHPYHLGRTCEQQQ